MMLNLYPEFFFLECPSLSKMKIGKNNMPSFVEWKLMINAELKLLMDAFHQCHLHRSLLELLFLFEVRYFLVKLKKVKKSNEQVLVINEVLTIAPVSIIVKSSVADSDTLISFFSENGPVKVTELVSRDDSYVNKSFFYGDRPSRIPSSTNISNSTIRNGDASEALSCRLRFTSLENNKTFYTDSNGSDFIKRIRDYRTDWDLQVDQPVAGNYYPLCIRNNQLPS